VIDYELLPAQDDFIFSDAKYPAIVGGLGSGKSRAGTLRLVTKLIHSPGLSGAYYMPTYDLINLRAMPGVEEDLQLLNVNYVVNKSQYTIHIDGGGSIIFRSYDNPNRIIAYEVAHSICDELDTLPKDKAAIVWRKISERNRQICSGDNTIGLVTTPDQGINGFVYDKWVKRKQPGYVLYKASTRSNKHLPAGYVQQILDNYDPVLAALYSEGEFVSLNANKIYHFYGRFRHASDRVIKPDDRLHIGIDFNIGGCVATVFVIERGEVHAVDEFISYDTRDFVNNLTRYAGSIVTVYPDASGRDGHTSASESDISIIQNAGYNVLCHNSNPAVRDRINAVNGMLAHNRLFINEKKCPDLVCALESQGYNIKGEPEKFDSHPACDDWCDSLGYFIAYMFPVGRELTRSKFNGI
jgi:hypothetical protein